MRIIDDWLEDWISERTNVLADDMVSLSDRLRQSALDEGYSLKKLEYASNGDVDRFVRRAVVHHLIARSDIAPVTPPYFAMRISQTASSGATPDECPPSASNDKDKLH
ncbi:hypothetical protein [Neorhizobium sp. T25_13]|uniref:hypothetical protein n=1 Tax=Neorhizobium sp. T25_13 TaxID=2093830 RepID=UPI000CF90F8B|nr:hypothetical protein [Neorhizobium sp. T25_13]